METRGTRVYNSNITLRAASVAIGTNGGVPCSAMGTSRSKYGRDITTWLSAPDFLMQELPQRLKQGPVTFHFKAQLAAAGDSTKDPAKSWPDDRKLVELGILTIDKAVPDSEEAQKKLLFLPGQLTDGIEESDDPMIDVRNGAYAVSFSRRNPRSSPMLLA
jgi:Catalase